MKYNNVLYLLKTKTVQPPTVTNTLDGYLTSTISSNYNSNLFTYNNFYTSSGIGTTNISFQKPSYQDYNDVFKSIGNMSLITNEFITNTLSDLIPSLYLELDSLPLAIFYKDNIEVFPDKFKNYFNLSNLNYIIWGFTTPNTIPYSNIDPYLLVSNYYKNIIEEHKKYTYSNINTALSVL